VERLTADTYVCQFEGADFGQDGLSVPGLLTGPLIGRRIRLPCLRDASALLAKRLKVCELGTARTVGSARRAYLAVLAATIEDDKTTKQLVANPTNWQTSTNAFNDSSQPSSPVSIRYSSVSVSAPSRLNATKPRRVLSQLDQQHRQRNTIDLQDACAVLDGYRTCPKPSSMPTPRFNAASSRSST